MILMGLENKPDIFSLVGSNRDFLSRRTELFVPSRDCVIPWRKVL